MTRGERHSRTTQHLMVTRIRAMKSSDTVLYQHSIPIIITSQAIASDVREK